MIGLFFWAIFILILELKRLFEHFQKPVEQQNNEKYKIMRYVDQMRDYLGFEKFKYLIFISSIINNGIYIIYYFLSMLYVGDFYYQTITSFLFINRILKISETLYIDFDKIDYSVGPNITISLKSIITIIHITITFVIVILKPS